MNILGTGLSGLVGSRVVELMPEHSFENLSLETGVDITDSQAIETYFSKSKSPWVFHMAAYTNVQAAETDRDMSWKVNVLATEYIAKQCKALGKKLLYIDTDYAFDGKKEMYSEEDEPNPLGWYAKTKTEGARRVLALGKKGLVIRISNPYRANPVGKKDFVHKIIEKLQSDQDVSGPTDQLFVPTFIDDIAQALRALIAADAFGIYHVVSSPAITPYAAGVVIAKAYGYDPNRVKKTTFSEMFSDRAPIPRLAALKNDKIQSLGVAMHSFADGINKIHTQEEKNI